ncbi:multifunctional 2',3'-cyclic-nucleotide 2'-phosphodiesterase/5'-nucleotidase/3'-nucleotidase [Salinimicrobium sp. CDJ15-81-2]|nr:multifunctional 2',3'-cyclic-nucleotide 2'-phosphodiesterase/5'-nucleotidase/3'-nucleotidase [Salinimicrobium nanhaiense]
MKRENVLKILSMVIMFTIITGCGQRPIAKSPNNEQQQTVTILHTNDIHGNYMPFLTTTGSATSQTGDAGRDKLITFKQQAEIGGFAVLATAVKEIVKSKGNENVLLLDSGDAFGDDLLGNLTQGEAVIRMMKKLDYDYLSLGNHDFDYGRERTEELMKIAGFPFGAANIRDNRTGKSIFDNSYLIKEIGGTKIAILSLGYHNTNLTGNSENMKDLEFLRGNEVLKEVLPELKDKADIIVLLSHQGTAVDRLTAEEFSEIDIILGGHSHDLITKPEIINNTYMVQALSDAAVLGEIDLEIKDRKLTGVKANHRLLWLSDFEKDREMENLIEELRASYRDHLEEGIATATEVIDRQYKTESSFDKLVGNLLRKEYDAEIAFLPGVGYGISLQGEITRENLYRLIPHPPKVATLSLTGKQVKATLEQTATNQKPGDKYEVVGGLLQSSGVSYTLDYSKTIGDRINGVQVNGKDLDPEKEYKIVTHSGMLKGLHRYDEIGKGKNIDRKDIQLNEFVAEKFRELKDIRRPENMEEIKIIK